MRTESSSRDQRRIQIVAVSLMSAVSVIVLALTLWMLYESNFDQHAESLQAMVREQVSLIEAVARFDEEHVGGEFAGDASAATVQQVVEGYSDLGGFGETGELVLGVRRGDEVQFLSEFRFPQNEVHEITAIDADRGAPMRRALNNESGWLIGLDYRGKRVLAAYAPIPKLDLGLVAKIDMREVQAPFMRAALSALGVAAVVIVIGGILVLRMARAVFRRIEESQERFRRLLESAPDAMVIIDESRTIVMVNHQTEEIFGYSRDEIVGQPIEMLVPHRFRPNHPEHVRSFFRSPSARPIGAGLDLFALTSGGSEFPVEISLSPIQTTDGLLVASSLRDITERKAAEDALKALNEDAEHQRKTETALNELSGVLRGQQEMGNLAHVIVDQLARHLDLQLASIFVRRDGDIYVREAAFGYPKQGGLDRFEPGDGLLGQVVENATPLSVDRVPEYAQLALGLGTVTLGSLLIYPLVHDGSVVAVLELGGLEPLDESQQSWLEKASDGLSVTLRLVLGLERRNRTERELAEAKEAAETASIAKSHFLANMSHELRTPMNAILGYSEMLMEEAEDVGQDDFIPDLKRINQAGNHLLSLINDVLDLSKVEAGRMEVLAEDIDVSSLLDEVAATATPLMAKNANEFRIDCADQLGSARQDLTKLRQSLLNLLSNAAKFTSEGTIVLRAEREPHTSGDWLVFSVIDSGIGISEDKLDHVFEEFSQADSSTTRDYGGTGLGLSISRRFCQMLGGEIKATSVLGEGSTFTIRLPARIAEASTDAPRDFVSIKTDSELSAIRRSGTERTVLVIDDDSEARDIVERFLQRDGFDVVTAASGEEGLRLAHELRPAAITLDVMMPDMDGWSVLRALKADRTLSDVPVLMLTMVDDKSKGYSLGATDYLTKPVDREKLHDALIRHVVSGESRTVLIVEDDKMTRDMMARTLEKSGWQVDEAANGREALERLAEKMPRLILLDLMMPVMDGFEFVLEMRTHKDWRDIPIVVLTAKDLTDEDRRILSGRVQKIIEKGGHSLDDVVKLIRRALARDRSGEGVT